MRKSIAIVIPTFNERHNISLLIDKLFSILPDIRIVVVDDNSPDKTAQVVQNSQKKYSRLDLIIRKEDKGRGAACLAGFQYVLKKYKTVSSIVEMDSDFSHNPSDIPELIKASDENTVSIGSRYVLGSKIINWPLRRIILSRFANAYIRFFLGIPIADYTMGFRCYSKKALLSLKFSKIRYKGFITLSEIAYMLYKKGFKFKEIPIQLSDRTRGKSNANMREVLRSFIAILALRFNR